ncbi:MAG: DciA family protein [Alphaproteobacteria bacterium]|nr:DciA family protein [Alphaproteobacteria bacterium]
MRKIQSHRPERGLTAINQFLESALQKSLKRQGFTVYGVVADWEKIVGPVLARYSLPARVRRAPDGENASLEIKIAAGIGLEFQHFQPQLIERVNQYYGFRAITRLQLRQGFVPPPKQTSPPAPKKIALPPEILAEIDKISHKELRQALLDLGSAIYQPK